MNSRGCRELVSDVLHRSVWADANWRGLRARAMSCDGERPLARALYSGRRCGRWVVVRAERASRLNGGVQSFELCWVTMLFQTRRGVNWVVYLGMNDGETLEQPPRGNAMLLQNFISNSYGIYFRD